MKRPGGRGFEQAISRILFPRGLATAQVAIIYLGRRLPGVSSDQPESWQASNLQACRLTAHYSFCSVLLRMGFTQPAGHPAAGELLPHHFALTRHQCHFYCWKDAGRYVSVALSLESPPLAVSQHPALWSSDFPRVLRPAIACLTQTHPIRV